MFSNKCICLAASMVLALAQTTQAQPTPSPTDVFVVDLEDDVNNAAGPPAGVVSGPPDSFSSTGSRNDVEVGAGVGGPPTGLSGGPPAGIDFAACAVEQEVVEPFDVEGYMGTWYEIATNNLVRNTFEQGCECTTANYELFDNGTVQVKNTCIRNGEPYELIGAATAEVPDKGAFTVSFGEANTGPVLGENYLILAQGNDEANGDAQYTVVGSVCNAIGWILSRSTTMSDEAYGEAVAVFEERGYKPTSEAFNLQKSNQDEKFCAPIRTDE